VAKARLHTASDWPFLTFESARGLSSHLDHRINFCRNLTLHEGALRIK
jgi:hypothetical protein